MSAHTVSDGGGTAGPPLVAGNPKKPPDKGDARVDGHGVDVAPDVQKTPTGAAKSLWTGVRRRLSALTSPGRRGESSAELAEQGGIGEARASEQPSPTKNLSTKRRKLDKDDVWSSAPLVPEVHMIDEESELHEEASDEEDVFGARPHITPMPVPQTLDTTTGALTAEVDMSDDTDDESVRTIRTTLADDIARIRGRLTQDTFASEWVRKELALLVEHSRQLRRDAKTDTPLGFDFDTAATTPELVTEATPAPSSAIDARLAKLESSFAQLYEAITGGSRAPAATAAKLAEATSPAAPTAPQDPNSYAARASATPQTPTPAAKAPAAPSKGKNNAQGRRYEETRAILQLTTPLKYAEKTERSKRVAADTELVNDALLEHCGASMGPRVAGLSWSEHGNLVLMAMDGFTGEHLVEHAAIIAAALGITCEVKARRDVPWHKVTLARVPTYGPDGHLLTDDDIRANLRKTNPRFASLNLVDSLSPVHWLTSEHARRTQATASMVVCLTTQEDADTLLSLNNRIYVYGHTCSTRKFEERNAEPMCSNCWTVKLKHRTVSCKSDPRCKYCAGNHHTDEHSCKDCATERAASNGDEPMEDAGAAAQVGECAHIPLKCVNCGEGHAANDSRCPYRRKTVGSSAGVPPMSGLAQAKRPPRKPRKSPATGANATKPVERAAEVGWADPEVWPMELPYGDEEPAPATAADASASVDAPSKQADPPQAQKPGDAETRVLTIPSQTTDESAPLSGQAKRQARIKMLKEAFPSATEKEWRSWVGSANGEVEEAIRRGLAHYEENGKTVPGERKMDILRAQWTKLTAQATSTKNVETPDGTPRSKTDLTNLLNPVSPHESS